jgi:hypothetical protein
MQQSALVGGFFQFKKRISVSQKRQITLPIEFFNSLNIGQEVDCYVQNNSIVIRPVRDESGEFDELILADLISQGLAGEALLSKFKEIRKQIRPAVESILAEANSAALGTSDFATYDDIFSSEGR